MPCAAWPHRCCNLDGKDAVDMENGCITEEEMCANVEYLWCWGTSSASRATRRARTPCCGWRSLDFDNSAVSKQEVDAKLDAWEVQGARIRKEARRLQREG